MRPKLLVLASLLVLGGFAAGRLASPAAPPTPGRVDGAAAGASRTLLHYACPMHPTVRSDHPGTAPCCGMALAPVYAAGAPAEAAPTPAGAQAVDADLRQRQGVRVATVERAASTQALRLFGRVVPDETRVYSLNAAMEGSVRDLSAVTTGAQVRRDQVLGSVFMPDARAALQAYITALDAQDLDPQQRAHEAMRAFAGTTMSRASQYTVERLRGMGMSLRQIEEMRVRREVPITIDLVSPVDGVVLARSVTPGQKFEKGMEWFRIANLERVWILADLLEGDAALVRAGAAVKVTVPGRAGALAAVVSKVPPTFDPASRTLKVRLELDNPGRALLPDMYVDAEVAVERPAAIVLPVDAVLDSGLRSTVFVERGEGSFEPRQVEIGWRAGGLVEVRSGLVAGERVVVSGTFLVDSESQLRTAALHVQGEGRP